MLDEVVVVGYGAQKKASLTSSISQIKGDEAFKNKGIANATVAVYLRVADKPPVTQRLQRARAYSQLPEMCIRDRS